MSAKGMRLLSIILVSAVLFTGCAQSYEGEKLHDGYYTAEAADFVFGWKEYITIYVSNNRITSIEYDAYNASGFARSWDRNYMREMNAASGSYPNKFTRTYAISLLNWQNPESVDAVASATESHLYFQKLARAAIDQAIAGDHLLVKVELD